MKTYKHYNRYKKENKVVFTGVLIIILVCLVALAILTVTGTIDNVTWKPDVSYTMANQHIEWNYAGKVTP